MARMVSKCAAACILTGAVGLALAAPASARDQRQEPRRRPLAARITMGELLGQLWPWLRALAGEEGGLIDPNGLKVLRPALTDQPLVDGQDGQTADGVGRVS